MTWWCSATGKAWTWTWQAYPGVWLFVALLAAGYVVLRQRAAAGPAGRPDGRVAEFPSVWWGVLGLAAIWLALDWPVGALGAGYLASVHTLSYILLSLVAPPLLLRGIPAQSVRVLLDRLGWRVMLRFLARPPVALCLYTVVLLVTHVPSVVDSAMQSQLGAFAIDLAWLLAGLVMWWPVLAPQPEVLRLSRPLKMLYLFVGTLPTIVPSAFLTFADYPLYAVYELAPRVVPTFTAQQDQQVAGLTMKIVGDLPVWLAFGIIFFRWAAEEQRRAPPPIHPSVTRQG
jgi:putative membrane protein